MNIFCQSMTMAHGIINHNWNNKNMNNLTDEQLKEISYLIDDALADIGIKYQLQPLELCGITMARLIHIAEHSEDVYRLIESIASRQHLKPLTKTIQ